MVSGRYITIVNGWIFMGFISQLITWGPHPVVFNRYQHVKMEVYGAQTTTVSWYGNHRIGWFRVKMFPKEPITSNPIPLILNTHLETMGLDKIGNFHLMGVFLYPICEPWCWKMNPNICPCPKSPSHVGKYTIHEAYGWVNYNISLTWIVRPFGDDFLTNHDSRVRENSEAVIIYPELWITLDKLWLSPTIVHGFFPRPNP